MSIRDMFFRRLSLTFQICISNCLPIFLLFFNPIYFLDLFDMLQVLLHFLHKSVRDDALVGHSDACFIIDGPELSHLLLPAVDLLESLLERFLAGNLMVLVGEEWQLELRQAL